MRNLILISTLLLAPTAAHAFDLKMETGAFVGGHFFSDSTHLGRHDNAPASNPLEHSALFGFRVGFVLLPRLTLEAELALAPTVADEQASVLAFGYRAQLRVDILTGRFRPFVLAGVGGWTSSSSNPDVVAQQTRAELHAGAGLAADIGCQWGLGSTGGAVGDATLGSIATDGEVMLSLYGVFGKHAEEGANGRCMKVPAAPPDVDGDGVVDRADQCPTVAGLAENHGCPDKDTDGDGVPDRLDKCPDSRAPRETAAAPTSTMTTTASSTATTSARRPEDKAQLRGRRRLPRSRQRRGRHPRQGRQVPDTSPRPRTATRMTTAAPTRSRRR